MRFRAGSVERFPIIEVSPSSSGSQMEARPIRWKQGEILGQGAFGIVYLGLNTDTGELMAVKQVEYIFGIVYFPFPVTVSNFI
jgi:serine/threonine protein kinase